jgi:hypothetical protein
MHRIPKEVSFPVGIAGVALLSLAATILIFAFTIRFKPDFQEKKRLGLWFWSIFIAIFAGLIAFVGLCMS